MQLLTRIPGVRTLAGYQASWLRHDLVAGLVLTTLLVPQGMAYAELAGLPPEPMIGRIVAAIIGPSEESGPSTRMREGPNRA